VQVYNLAQTNPDAGVALASSLGDTVKRSAMLRTLSSSKCWILLAGPILFGPAILIEHVTKNESEYRHNSKKI